MNVVEAMMLFGGAAVALYALLDFLDDVSRLFTPPVSVRIYTAPPSRVAKPAQVDEEARVELGSARMRRSSILRGRWPCSTDTFGTEGWRLYWIGKAPRVRAAVEDYTARFATPEYETQAVVCRRHGVTGPSLRSHTAALLKNGLLRQIPPREEAEG